MKLLYKPMHDATTGVLNVKCNDLNIVLNENQERFSRNKI